MQLIRGRNWLNVRMSQLTRSLHRSVLCVLDIWERDCLGGAPHLSVTLSTSHVNVNHVLSELAVLCLTLGSTGDSCTDSTHLPMLNIIQGEAGPMSAPQSRRCHRPKDKGILDVKKTKRTYEVITYPLC